MTNETNNAPEEGKKASKRKAAKKKADDEKKKKAAEEQEGEARPQILQPDHLVVDGPDVGEEETLLVVMPLVVAVGVAFRNECGDARAHGCCSPLLRCATSTGSDGAAADWVSAALAAILPACHLSNSSCVTTRIGAFML